MAGFNEQQFWDQQQEIREDLKKYGLHHDKQFMKAFDGYMAQLHLNGQWLDQNHTPNAAWADTAATNLIAEFDRTNALHVPAKWWRENKRNKNFVAERNAKAQDTLDKKYLWSKTEPYYPARKAAEAGGLILETSFPGKIFNGKNFGFQNWSDAPVQAQLWEHMSSHYVDAARGPVEAVMLGGKVEGSVLTKHEWPHLKKRIEDGAVTNLHVKVMGFRNDSQASDTWSLETRATFNVTSQKSFDQIPSPQDPDFWDKQNRWRNQEKARNASKSSASSTSSQDSSTSNLSLKSFHKAFDDPSAVVVLADPGAPSTPGVASPGGEPLSQVLTRQMSVVQPAAPAKPTRQQTVDNVRAELQAQAAAVHSLDEKLAALRDQQTQRAAGTPAWPGTQNYEAGLSQGMSSMAPFRAPTLDYSPMASVPGASDSYFPPGIRYTAKPVTSPSYSYAPQTMGSALPQSESPLQTGSFEYPPAPVQGAQSFNPTYTTTQERTPSTGSASSDFGAPLQPTQRHPSPPSEVPAPAPSSSSRHGHGEGKKPKKKEPSSALQWLAGGKPGGRKK